MDQLIQEIYAKQQAMSNKKRKSSDSESDFEEYEPQRKKQRKCESESEDELRPPFKRRLSSSSSEDEIRPPLKRRLVISSSDSGEDEIRPPLKRRLVILSSDSSDIEPSVDQIEELNIEVEADEAPALQQIVEPISIKNSNFTQKGNKSASRLRDGKGRFLKCSFLLPSHQSRKIRKTEVDKLTESSFLGVGVVPFTLLDLPSLTRSGLQFRDMKSTEKK